MLRFKHVHFCSVGTAKKKKSIAQSRIRQSEIFHSWARLSVWASTKVSFTAVARLPTSAPLRSRPCQHVTSISNWIIGSGWQLCWHLEDTLTSRCPHTIRENLLQACYPHQHPSAVHATVSVFSVQALVSEQLLLGNRKNNKLWGEQLFGIYYKTWGMQSLSGLHHRKIFLKIFFN